MNSSSQNFTSENEVLADLQRQPLILMRLAENALSVAESCRDNYFKHTSDFIKLMRGAMRQTRDEPIFQVQDIDEANWSEFANEVVTFIDGGLGQVKISGNVPILLRVGSYCVRTGETRLSEREQLGYYPVILGDLEGGSKDRKDFSDIVRITAELLGGLAALERMPDLSLLMFHGPLVNLVGKYTTSPAHTPFTENDIDIFLNHYAPNSETATKIKEEFLSEAKLDVYPQISSDRSYEWSSKRVFEPLSWIAFLYRKLIKIAKERNPIPIIAGVVERGNEMREFSKDVLMTRVFRGLKKKGNENRLNELYERTDLLNPDSFIKRLNYTDTLLLAMLMRPGQRSESWEMSKYEGLGGSTIVLPNESFATPVNFSVLRPGTFGFPSVMGFYVHVAENTEPVRVEIFKDLNYEQIDEVARRVYLYSRLLPGYGFPVGLDIVDKFAKVPAWMTDAYAKLIKLHLGISLQSGEISDKQMREILVQSIYMTHRDWLFRPKS